MRVHLTSAYSKHCMLDALKKNVTAHSRTEHQICESAEAADIILFVEDGHFDDYRYRQLGQHELIKKYNHKCFMYNELDRPSLVLPGLYCNMTARFFDTKRQIAFPFLSTPNRFVKNIYKTTLGKPRDTLFSFVGAASHRCRKTVLQLSPDNLSRGLLRPKDMPAYNVAGEATRIEDTSVFNVWHSSDEVREFEGHKFAAGMTDCLYSLCPRGLGTSSFRLFESMEAGRAPVIISDNWVETAGVDWSFALRVKEKNIRKIPKLLASLKDEAVERGHSARKQWARAYAPEQLFHTAIESLTHLQADRRVHRKVYLASFHQTFIKGEMQTIETLRDCRNKLLPKAQLSP